MLIAVTSTEHETHISTIRTAYFSAIKSSVNATFHAAFIAA